MSASELIYSSTQYFLWNLNHKCICVYDIILLSILEYFGDIELLVTEMSVEIFEESVAHFLSLNEDPVEEEGLDAQNDSRIL